MSGLFAWSMRSGAAILFGGALLVLVVTFVTYVTGFTGMAAFETQGIAEKPHPLAHLWSIVAGAVKALHAASLPFFGALLINRLDRWREARA